MNEFIWNDRYKVGDETIDAQHRALFELADEIVGVTDNARVTHLLMLFYQHAREHFSTEEQLMKQVAYPGYESHLQAHNQMLDKLVEISEIVQKHQWNPSDIKVFVNRWVLVHILDEDLPLGDYIRSHAKQESLA
ncbi:MAG: bacteriohemerythrin [Gammaproteobacteria bacterium]